MKVIEVDNVNEALPAGLAYLAETGEIQASRAGAVVVARVPVTTVYRHPSQKVLFSPLRDNNPFFSFMEALWMLGGRNDATFLDHYVKDFSARFAEPDGEMHGAYGHRWRKAFGFDQLDAIVARLKANPDDRQCVLQMWDSDILGTDDLEGDWRDRPCNTHAYFRARDGFLSMTVCCRSNDILWGAYGANAVHFSVLLEYLAMRTNLAVGTYYQMSNNYHMYVSEIERLGKKMIIDTYLLPTFSVLSKLSHVIGGDHYPKIVDYSTFSHERDIDKDIRDTLNSVERIHEGEKIGPRDMINWGMHATAVYMARAYQLFRAGHMEEALAYAQQIPFSDWNMACEAWLKRRVK